MRVAAGIATCIAIVTAPLMTKGDPLYVACGPQAVGLIIVGGKKACLQGPRNETQKISEASGTPRASVEPTVTAGTSKDVDESLNDADLRFRSGDKKNACVYVGTAISQANRNSGTGAVSENQKQQIRDYAQQCNLRY